LTRTSPWSDNKVTFDELSGKQLTNLIVKIFKMIDPKIEYSLSDSSEEVKAQVSDLLAILAFPEATDEKFIDEIFAGDKKQIDRIIYYCLKNFEDLKERAYLGSYLAPMDIPNEFLMDEEMRQLEAEFKELQNVFQQEHQELTQIRSKAPKNKDLQKEIKQLEAERDQLKVRISNFQQKAETKDPVAANQMRELLVATKLLRKEQEEENSLMDKLRIQKGNLEQAEKLLLMSKQRLFDTQKACGQEVS